MTWLARPRCDVAHERVGRLDYSQTRFNTNKDELITHAYQGGSLQRPLHDNKRCTSAARVHQNTVMHKVHNSNANNPSVCTATDRICIHDINTSQGLLAITQTAKSVITNLSKA